MKIVFSYLGVKRKYSFNSSIKELIKFIVKEENKRLGEIGIILTTNPRILEINSNYLNHNYYTDVITFSNNKRDFISGDLYISVDQVNSNALAYNSNEKDELVRVIIHGILHLIGYDDKKEDDKIIMRKMEDKYLCRFKSVSINFEGESKI